jgi:hypothetical protein
VEVTCADAFARSSCDRACDRGVRRALVESRTGATRSRTRGQSDLCRERVCGREGGPMRVEKRAPGWSAALTGWDAFCFQEPASIAASCSCVTDGAAMNATLPQRFACEELGEAGRRSMAGWSSVRCRARNAGPEHGRPAPGCRRSSHWLRLRARRRHASRLAPLSCNRIEACFVP